MINLKILSHTPDIERVIACAAKLCYSPVGVDEINEKLTDYQIKSYLQSLISMGHESPLEHGSITFAVEGISRACSHQIVRHRIASYSQQSQRYVKEKNFDYIIPEEISKVDNLSEIFINHMRNNQIVYDLIVDKLIEKYSTEDIDLYNEYTENSSVLPLDVFVKTKYKNKYKKFEKKAIENARYVFPNATETKMVFTMNCRSLLNFFSERCCERAQDEIRDLANLMLDQSKIIAPTIFEKAGPPCTRGLCKEGKLKCK